MRVLLTGPINYHYSNDICDSFKRKGYDVCFFPMTEFYRECSYVEKKLFKCGFSLLKNRYDTKWENDLVATAQNFKPDVIIILNGLMLSHSLMKKLQSYEKIWWLWDSIERMGKKYYEYLGYFSDICVYEYDDISKIRSQYRGNIIYLPLGYDERTFRPCNGEKTIDISFIGAPNEKRLMFLEQIAQAALNKGWSMYVGGLWYPNLPWKKYRFKHKFPCLYRFVNNKIHNAEECAEIYQKSKVCLNINVLGHKSVNPRTFEILACKTCQLINAEVELNELLEMGRDVDSFFNVNDAVEKMELYLNDSDKRKELAEIGYKNNKSNSIDRTIEKIEMMWKK